MDSLHTLLAESAQSRKALKRHAVWLSQQPRGTWQELLVLCRARGLALPDEALDWPAKRLIRRALDRQGQAQERLNPTHLDEAFACAHCGAQVPKGGRPVRDHCPSCLHSLHVDVVPGDRAADCGGLMAPTGAQQRAGRWVIHYLCKRCGHVQNNRAHPSDEAATLAKISTLT